MSQDVHETKRGRDASCEAVWEKVFQAKERAKCKGPEVGMNFCV